MRAIDADALQKQLTKKKPGPANARYTEGFNDALLRFKSMIHSAPPIEPRKKGKWINIRHDNIAECDQCGITGRAWMNFCFDCGADMRTPVETARDIVHEAIDNSVWVDAIDTAKIHKVVDDKYAEIGGDVNADANT